MTFASIGDDEIGVVAEENHGLGRFIGDGLVDGALGILRDLAAGAKGQAHGAGVGGLGIGLEFERNFLRFTALALKRQVDDRVGGRFQAGKTDDVTIGAAIFPVGDGVSGVTLPSDSLELGAALDAYPDTRGGIGDVTDHRAGVDEFGAGLLCLGGDHASDEEQEEEAELPAVTKENGDG